MRLWTQTIGYLNAVQARVERIDLYGNPAGPVSDEEQAGAQQWLNVLFGQQRRRNRQLRKEMLARAAGRPSE